MRMILRRPWHQTWSRLLLLMNTELTAISQSFAVLLRSRLQIISDRDLYQRDPAAHLAQLQNVSSEITALHATTRGTLPARLNHFLDQSSFQKALEFIDAAGA